jgi:hypothetical protein
MIAHARFSLMRRNHISPPSPHSTTSHALAAAPPLSDRMLLVARVRVRLTGAAAATLAALAVSSSSSNDAPQMSISSAGPPRGLDALRQWKASTTLGLVDRADPTAPDPARRVLVVLGITGSGKSSTSNTLAGRTIKPFTLSSSLTSVTQAVQFRDYTFLDTPWRVVDTPGLCDTNKSASEVRAELLRLARYSPHGVTSFVLVVPRGRFTPEQETALKDLTAIFGDPELQRHSVIAVTSAIDLSEGRNLLPRDVLVDEINGLPITHYFRRFVEAASTRVVPVENRTDPQRQISRMTLHQRILEVEDANKGRRYETARFLLGPGQGDVEGEGGSGAAGQGAGAGVTAAGTTTTTEAAAAAAAAAERARLSAVVRDGHQGNVALERALRSMHLGHCESTVARRPPGNRLHFTLDCELKE